MIIDSHAHYSRFNFDETFRYLSYGNNSYIVNEGTREDVLNDMANSNIVRIIEPGVELESNEQLIAFSKEHPGVVYGAVGVHPTRTCQLSFKDRKKNKRIR